MDESMETFVPLTFRRRGVQRVAADERSVHDVTLLDGVARAFYWQHLLDTGAMQSGSAIATWATQPVSKKDFSRAKLRSMNWSMMTKVPGERSSRSEPTAESEISSVQPIRFMASILAR